MRDFGGIEPAFIKKMAAKFFFKKKMFFNLQNRIINSKNPILQSIANYIILYFTPVNFSYAYSFGFLIASLFLLMCLKKIAQKNFLLQKYVLSLKTILKTVLKKFRFLPIFRGMMNTKNIHARNDLHEPGLGWDYVEEIVLSDAEKLAADLALLEPEFAEIIGAHKDVRIPKTPEAPELIPEFAQEITRAMREEYLRQRDIESFMEFVAKVHERFENVNSVSPEVLTLGILASASVVGVYIFVGVFGFGFPLLGVYTCGVAGAKYWDKNFHNRGHDENISTLESFCSKDNENTPPPKLPIAKNEIHDLADIFPKSSTVENEIKDLPDISSEISNENLGETVKFFFMPDANVTPFSGHHLAGFIIIFILWISIYWFLQYYFYKLRLKNLRKKGKKKKTFYLKLKRKPRKKKRYR